MQLHVILYTLSCSGPKWATSWQNQQKGRCVRRRLRSAWASTQSDQSSLCTQWVAKNPSFHHADSEDPDQSGQMPRLIWVSVEAQAILLDLLWCSSNIFRIIIKLLPYRVLPLLNKYAEKENRKNAEAKFFINGISAKLIINILLISKYIYKNPLARLMRFAT